MKKQMKSAGTAFLPKLRQVLLKSNLAMVMALQLMFFSCTRDKVVSDLSTQKAINNANLQSGDVSDEDVFRGIVFMRGPVASMFADYQELSIDNILTDPDQYAEAKAFQEKLIDEIDTEYPDFFSDFRQGISSGDYETVEMTLKDAGEKIHEMSIYLTGKTNAEYNTIASNIISKYSLSEQSTQQEILTAVQDEIEYASSIAIHVSTVIAITVALAWVWLWVFDGPPTTATLGTYARADFTSEITTQMEGY